MRRRVAVAHAVIALAAALVSLVALLPLGFVVWIAMQTGWETASTLIFRPRVGELLINTALLVALTIPLAIVARRRACLADRAHRPARRAPLGLAGSGAACGSGFCA